MRAGTITGDHVDAVACARRRIDAALRTGFDGEDAAICDQAVGHSPDQLADWLRWLVRRLETGHNRDLALRRKRAVRVRKWVDHAGMYRLDGTFDPEMGAGTFTAIDTAVDALRKHPGEVVPGEDPTDPLGNDGEFLAAHALARLVNHGHATTRPGVPDVVVLIDQSTLTHGEHDGSVCEFDDGTGADPFAVRRMCCDAVVTAVVVSANGTMPLNVGRSQRSATRAQRRALRAVHRHCAIDGCTTPFQRCEIHHLWYWDLGGPTDLDNLVPLCLRHHHLVHDAGWRLTLNPTDRTLTLYRPDGTIYREMRPPGLRPPPDTADINDGDDAGSKPATGPRGRSCTTAA